MPWAPARVEGFGAPCGAARARTNPKVMPTRQRKEDPDLHSDMLFAVKDESEFILASQCQQVSMRLSYPNRGER